MKSKLEIQLKQLKQIQQQCSKPSDIDIDHIFTRSMLSSLANIMLSHLSTNSQQTISSSRILSNQSYLQLNQSIIPTINLNKNLNDNIINQLQSKLKTTNTNIQNNFISNQIQISSNNQKIKILQTEMKQVKEKINSKQKQLTKLKYNNNNSNWFIQNQLNRSHFYVVNKTVEYFDKDNTWTQFIFSKPITYENIQTFKIKIIRSVNLYIMIGVIDLDNQNNARNSYNINGNAIYYYTPNATIWPGNTNTGGGALNLGDTVTVTIDRKQNYIKWAVGNTVKYYCKCDMLGNQSKKMMPSVELYNKNDVIEWVQ